MTEVPADVLRAVLSGTDRALPTPRESEEQDVPVGTDVERQNFLKLIERLLDTYRPEGVLIWLAAGNRQLGGYSPRQLIAEGEWESLLALADRMTRQ